METNKDQVKAPPKKEKENEQTETADQNPEKRSVGDIMKLDRAKTTLEKSENSQSLDKEIETSPKSQSSNGLPRSKTDLIKRNNETSKLVPALNSTKSSNGNITSKSTSNSGSVKTPTKDTPKSKTSNGSGENTLEDLKNKPTRDFNEKALTDPKKSKENSFIVINENNNLKTADQHDRQHSSDSASDQSSSNSVDQLSPSDMAKTSKVAADVCKVFGVFFAIGVRLVLLAFSMFTVAFVVQQLDNERYWLLLLLTSFIVLEGIHIVLARSGQERKW